MFETLAIPRPARKVWLAGPAAVLAHAVVVGAFLAASLWKTGGVDAPTVRILSGPISLLPPPARGEPNASEAHPAHPAARRGAVPPPISAPAIIPSALPLPSTSEVPVESVGPRSVGEGSGTAVQPDGVEGGTGTDTIGTPGIVSATAPNVVPPRLLSGPEPAYPEASRRLREEGIVILQAFIGTDGRVENVVVLRGASRLLEDEAIRAISGWRYAPATLNGRAIRVYLSVTVRFALH